MHEKQTGRRENVFVLEKTPFQKDFAMHEKQTGRRANALHLE